MKALFVLLDLVKRFNNSKTDSWEILRFITWFSSERFHGYLKAITFSKNFCSLFEITIVSSNTDISNSNQLIALFSNG